MPKCINNPQKSYIGNEPSPKGRGYCASSEKIGSKKIGLDGNMWIVSKDNKRWIKQNKTVYKTHFNGGKPFKVYIMNKAEVEVYKYVQLKEMSDFYDTKHTKINKNVIKITKTLKNGMKPPTDEDLFTYKFSIKFDNVKKIFVPEEADKFAIGNTILLLLDNNKYVYIGAKIYTFETKDNDKITEYHSYIGNNDIPYPIAISKKRAYFMLDDVYVDKAEFPVDIDWRIDAYNYFYTGICSTHNIKKANHIVDKHSHKMYKYKVLVKNVL